MAAAITGLVVLAGCSQVSPPAPEAAKAGIHTGSIKGADFKIEFPRAWNGTLLIYSHGYAAPDGGNPASDAGDSTTGTWLVEHGYALAGSSFRSTGWALEDAFKDQVSLLDHFSRSFGKPKRTIAWGHSLGGIITAGLAQLHPERLDGALAMCGVLAGGIANWNGALDIGFATKTLLDPGLQIVNITNPGANLSRARAAVTAAGNTPQGKARISLIAALGHLPGWFNPLQPEPAADDYALRVANQASWEAFDFTYVFGYRAELERRAGGNPSWNTGVDYRQAFESAPSRSQTEALYRLAGLDLEAELTRLNSTPRISADRTAADYLARNITFNGRLALPFLTLHTTDDGLVLPENEEAYMSVVGSGPDSGQLRQLFTHRANHCIFTPAEQIAAFKVLFARLDGKAWPPTDPPTLNQAATALGSRYNGGSLPGSATVLSVTPAFASYQPARFPRPFDSRSVNP
ncbi:MAG: S9 family peptidase [Candidatus Dormibacteraeota bacterium]|nr:S9 family peptidase [Candidatus Dormibacteraeota bacterium]